MKIFFLRFNIYLLALAIILVPGCSTKKNPRKRGKEATVISFHMEMNQDGTERCIPATIYRQKPTSLWVNRSPFLHEGYVENADVVDAFGSFELQIKFDRTGTLLLENITSSNRGRHIAIFCQFGDARWIAAPILNRRISDGILTFTPDTTRTEAERIARGLNNIADEVQDNVKANRKKKEAERKKKEQEEKRKRDLQDKEDKRQQELDKAKSDLGK